VAFAQAQVLRRHLQQLVVSQEVQRLLEAQLRGRGQPHRDVGCRRADVGLLLLPADVDPDVAWPLLNADDHPLVHRLPRLDEGGTSLLCTGQPESERGARRGGGEGAVALFPEVARPGPVADAYRTHETGTCGQRQEAVPKPDQTAGWDQILETHAALRVVADLDQPAGPRAQRLGDRAEVLFADVDGQSLDRLHALAVDLLDYGLGAGDLELEALPAHGLYEHRQVELAAAAHQEALGRLGVFDVKPEVDIELLVQAGAQLPRRGELALTTGERRRVDAKCHPDSRFVDLYAGQRIGRL